MKTSRNEEEEEERQKFERQSRREREEEIEWKDVEMSFCRCLQTSQMCMRPAVRKKKKKTRLLKGDVAFPSLVSQVYIHLKIWSDTAYGCAKRKPEAEKHLLKESFFSLCGGILLKTKPWPSLLFHLSSCSSFQISSIIARQSS